MTEFKLSQTTLPKEFPKEVETAEAIEENEIQEIDELLSKV